MLKTLKTIAALPVLISICGAAGQAAAETRGISIPPASIAVQGTAIADSPVALPNSATPTMIISFVLPPDYMPDSTVKMLLMSHPSNQFAGACKAVLSVEGSNRSRNGLATSNSSGGVEPAGNIPVVAYGGPLVVKSKVYVVKPPAGGPITGTRPGDVISIRIDRLVNDSADTCAGSVFVSGALVEYQSAP